MARRIESHRIPGPAGKLESLLEEPEHADPSSAALVCHPHPLYGGTMHNKVVYRLARGLRHAGAAVLRFNFRGVGHSQGKHGHGPGELEDARAALAWLLGRYPGLPFTLAGFSFGSRTVLELACTGELKPLRVIAAGYPTHFGTNGFLDPCTVPKVFIQSTHDQYGPPPEMEPLFARIAEPKQLIWIEARDHFFAGALEQVEETVFNIQTAKESGRPGPQTLNF